MNISRSFILAAMLCAALIIISQPCNAQTPPGPGLAGNWEGTLTAGATKVRMVLNIKQDSVGKFSATLDLPDNGAQGLPVQYVIYADRILSFNVNIGAPSSYEGAVSRDFTEVVGNLKQGANIIPLNFTHTGAKLDANVAKPAILSGHKLELQPCGVAGVTKDAWCGQYEVYEDRAKKSGRKIKLYVMVLPALIDKPAPDPIFYFQGGPGGAATSVAPAWIMTQLHRTRDVVLVDQRGTGKSNPLSCNFRGDPNDMRGYFSEYLTLEGVRACRTELEKNADLRLYTTTIAMADLDDVRVALGYDKINVYGGSYGSTAALSYLNFYPQHVRTVTISGVAPPHNTLLLAFAKGTEHALNRLFDDCAADEKCKAAFPDLRKDWDNVVARLTKEPATFDTLNPFTHQKQQVTMTREGFGELVRLVLYVPNVMSIMPLMIHQMSQGDYSQFGFYAFQVQRGVDLGLARGMQLSVFCAENVPLIKESEIEPATAGTFYGGNRVRTYLKACNQWPRGEVPARFYESIKSAVPVLMLSGDLDPVTPPDAATPLLRWLPNGRQIIMHNATHNTYECQEKLARDFIERGTVKDLDASCVEGMKRLPFLNSLPALPIPK
jgi:pimeloyl-ACP methyl ester carboxylesterase